MNISTQWSTEVLSGITHSTLYNTWRLERFPFCTVNAYCPLIVWLLSLAPKICGWIFSNCLLYLTKPCNPFGRGRCTAKGHFTRQWWRRCVDHLVRSTAVRETFEALSTRFQHDKVTVLFRQCWRAVPSQCWSQSQRLSSQKLKKWTPTATAVGKVQRFGGSLSATESNKRLLYPASVHREEGRTK